MHPTVGRTALVLTALLFTTPAFAAEASRPVVLPGGRVIKEVDFERHVMGLIGRAGCASGSCHGSFQGKGGLQVSLFGYNPDMDYRALVRDNYGRRVNFAAPEQSLVLLKATGSVPHGGKTRFGKNSWQYRLLHTWIVQGAQRKPGSGEVKSVSISPPELALKGQGEKGQLKVEATFADGTREDITPLCDFRSNDDAVVEVNTTGGVRGLRPGDTAVVVSYRGTVLPVRVMVPVLLAKGKAYPRVPEVNYVDREVFAKLRRLNIIPSKFSGDEEFLRRLTIDTIGSLPTPQEVREFLADKDPKKREKAIDRLLAHPRHAALWATKFCDITGNNTDGLENPPQRKPFLSQMWHDWFRCRLEKNVPYDKIVRGVLTATSLEGKTPEEYLKLVEKYEEAQEKGEDTGYAERETLDLFWRKQQRVTVEEWGEKTAAAFMGVRLECAQCHKHPFDRWTQADYRAYANVFASLNTAGASPAGLKVFREAVKERQKKSQQRLAMLRKMGKKVNILPIIPQIREVHIGRPQRALPHPDTNRPLPMKALGGPVLKAKAGDDPRVEVMDWLIRKDNPFFARAFVNRVWGHYFSVGIVHPVDDFSLANPPSNPKLLDALARDFVESGYDIRAIEKRVLMSRAYQLSSVPNETNRLDRNNYARAYVRPLMAEVVVDVLNDAIGTSERWAPNEARPNSRAIEVGASRVNNANVSQIFRVFGRPPRTTACDCERAMEPALPQKLYLIADDNLLNKLRQPNNRLGQLLKDHTDDDRALEELFLATLSRLPTEKDRQHFQAYKEKKAPSGPAARRAMFNDVLWALVNTSEFIFNH